MKTEKQIKLRQVERGKELFEKVQNLDSIKINIKDATKWFSDLSEYEEVVYTPIIKTGVLLVVYDDYTGYVAFDIDFQDNYFVICADIFNNMKGDYRWICTLVGKVPYTPAQQETDYEIIGFKNATTEIMNKQRKKQEDINMYIEYVMDDATKPFDFFVECYELYKLANAAPGIQREKNERN